MTIYPDSDTSMINSPSTSTNLIEISTVEKEEKQRASEDWNHRNPSVDSTGIESVSAASSEDGSVALASASTSGYRGGHQPRTTQQKSKMLTARVTKIYGFPTTSTPLAGVLNKKELMKNPPLTLLNETNGINFLQGLHGHGQSHGCFVPSL